MRSYKKWICFTNNTKFPLETNVYVEIGNNKLGNALDCLEIREDVILEHIFPCIDKGVTLRIYWREK